MSSRGKRILDIALRANESQRNMYACESNVSGTDSEGEVNCLFGDHSSDEYQPDYEDMSDSDRESVTELQPNNFVVRRNEDENICENTVTTHANTLNFNLSFGYPKSDTCSIWDAGESNEEHVENYHEAYDALKTDREKVKGSYNLSYMTMDLQQTIPLPRLSTSKAFYLRQLWMCNFGTHISTKEVEKAVFCSWTEDQASRGSSEVFSCLLTILELEDSVKNKDHLIIWSDSCAGRNKNFLIICLYQYLIHKGLFKIIDHKFPEVGHTYLDSDRDFGRIEKNLRKHQKSIERSLLNPVENIKS
ncbi:unnamed protein product [Acanthoscelides obtectus]|uniref:DUF7869 domain-containing protein n=1 Tax=Acanthoscelides obtectus TaxID=200917 RepID=A0A9P0Q2Q9_ACAOB|nr:unnamed protein product [Acanthoscelides obtectus]CAK1678436.1 hypothetical protein AOBTE_LOCUS31903 [Acanthoscelides obtectus]